jgi:hypothetical protein
MEKLTGIRKNGAESAVGGGHSKPNARTLLRVSAGRRFRSV